MAKPWFALLALWALLESPNLLGAPRLGPSADVPLLIALWLWGARVRSRGGWMRLLALSCAGLLAFYALDRALLRAFMGEQPLLYDQLFMLRHLYVLVSDLWSLGAAALFLTLPLVLVACIWLVRRLLHNGAGVLAPEQRRARITASLGLVVLVLASSVAELSGMHYLRFSTGHLLRDVLASRALYAQVQRRFVSSPYEAYRSLSLRRRPNISLVLVESYGRVMSTHPAMARPLRERLTRMQKTVTGAGWHTASAFSTAPVVGGRSWLAEASVLLGMRVPHESLFHHLATQMTRLPNLVRLLRAQGYYSVLLAPADRVRSGVEEADYYGYDRCVRFSDLAYRGPAMGWGIVPDQYSLAHTEERVLKQVNRPTFFNFHMVSSHAPWEVVPALVGDWRSLGVATAAAQPHANEGQFFKRLRRYGQRRDRFAGMGKLRPRMAEGYRDAILYELELLERHLTTLQGDSLVIVMGDHQPPFLSRHTESYDTPVHVFARDPRLLDEFVEQGFSWGLALARTQPARFRHEGLFSLLVRALARCCGDGAPLPPHLPLGAQQPGSETRAQ